MSLEACLPPALGIPRHPVSPPGVACPGPCDERVGSSSQGPFPRVVWALVPTFPAWGSRGPAEPAGGDARDSWEPRVREVLSSRLTWKLGVDPSDTAAISRMCCVSSGVQAGELPRGGDWGGGPQPDHCSEREGKPPGTQTRAGGSREGPQLPHLQIGREFVTECPAPT